MKTYLTEHDGSSPLARGLPARVYAEAHEVRIIPARAGFTGERRRIRHGHQDHPRSRGVYSHPERNTTMFIGSSPLARGLRSDRPERRRAGRIIPARAGFTPVGRRSRPRPWDHPRSRGVYFPAAWRSSTVEGSSPLARGLLATLTVLLLTPGIIPARAGFTRPAPALFLLTRDHPRSRGVYPESFQPSVSGLGSSPLARGLLLVNVT